MSLPLTRICLLALSALAAAVTGFVLVPPSAAVVAVKHGGYFIILTAFVGFLVSLWRLYRDTFEPRHWWTPGNGRLLGLVVIVALLWEVNGIHGFKVLMDEMVLVATSMSMHFDRQVFVPLKTHEVNGIYSSLMGIVDKRPLFFPFLLSLLHDVSGYRPGNVFFLNGLLSGLLLIVVGRLGQKLGGQEQAGLLAVALLGGLPLLALNATGAGFEILNLLMIAIVTALGWRYMAEPGPKTMDAFILAGVLLAQTRYESVLFVPAIGFIVIISWWQARRIIISPALVCAPLLLLPVPLLHRLFEINSGFWQIRGEEHGPFSPHYFWGNLGGAVEFLFTVDGFQLGSPLFSAVGLVCLLFFVVFILRRPRATLADPVLVVFASMAAAMLATFVLVLFYHWGQLQDFVATRLALPVLLLFALAAAFALGRWIKRPRLWLPILVLPLAWLLVGNVPLTARAEATRTFLTFHEAKHQLAFIRARRESHDLFIIPSTLPAIIERRPTVSLGALSERPEQMKFHLEQGTYENVWVFQRLNTDAASGVAIPETNHQLGPEFILELVEERRFKPLTTSRWSRLVRVDLSRQQPRPADWKPSHPPLELNIKIPDESAEGRFVQEFLRNLP